jgi:hypothetical protein
MYTIGLGEPLRTDVELQTPETLQRAMHLARVYERRLMLTGSSTGQSTPALVVPSKPSAPTMARPVATTANRPCLRRLSPDEVAAKCASGECYHCKEKYSPEHKCSGRGIFLLELEEEDATIEPQLPVDLGISLQAMTGIGVTDTLRLLVTINDINLTSLVDLSSTHTFLSEAALARLGLQVLP